MITLGRYADIAHNYNVITELTLCVQAHRKESVIRKFLSDTKKTTAIAMLVCCILSE